MGKTRGIGAGRKLRTVRRLNRWADLVNVDPMLCKIVCI